MCRPTTATAAAAAAAAAGKGMHARCCYLLQIGLRLF